MHTSSATDRQASTRFSRRSFLSTGVAGAASALVAGSCQPLFGKPGRRLRIAAVVTEYTYRSHAHVLLENFLEPYLFNGRRVVPDMDVVSLYVDQVPSNDLSAAISARYHIPIHKDRKSTRLNSSHT